MKIALFTVRHLLVMCLAFCTLLFGGYALAQDATEFTGCGEKQIVIADLQWPSASVLAHAHAQIIATQLKCNTSVVRADIESAATTLKTAQTPTLIPEMWVSRVADKWNQVIEARAGLAAGKSYDVAVFEGWYVAAKVVEDFPALKLVGNLKDMQALYQLEEKPEFITCPASWACSILNENMLKAFGLSAAFKVVVPENRLDMDRRIGAAVSSNRPTVFYYWQPNALAHDLGMRAVDLGGHSNDAFTCMGNKGCADFQPTGFANEQVVLALADWVRGDAPELLPYARKANMPMKVMDELLSVQVEGQFPAEQVATYFIVNYPEIWQAWLPVNSQ
ncbi:glycine betaine ABC transporter substrate-binding protein [uncultured Maritalea sp.]|uniref:glycine betaine ABC transporter substrate-binding protein n=1 Tax=uncultured Maritalea sp. TaxID=757249 RepID=UPI00260DDCE1|nr:glycine betaine ABC transporter substrate-binding protein [uncultured Maritalea sp.]